MRPNYGSIVSHLCTSSFISIGELISISLVTNRYIDCRYHFVLPREVVLDEIALNCSHCLCSTWRWNAADFSGPGITVLVNSYLRNKSRNCFDFSPAYVLTDMFSQASQIIHLWWSTDTVIDFRWIAGALCRTFWDSQPFEINWCSC